MILQFHVLSVEHAHRWKWRRLQREFDVVGIIADFVTEFYHATSKSLFLRLLSLDPPRPRADPEEAMMWLWKAHNRYKSRLSPVTFESQVLHIDITLEVPWACRPPQHLATAQAGQENPSN